MEMMVEGEHLTGYTWFRFPEETIGDPDDASIVRNIYIIERILFYQSSPL